MAVRYEPKGKIAYITLDRPEALNAFDQAMHLELHDAWTAFRDDPELWVAIVTGSGDRVFSAGADIKGWGGIRHCDVVVVTQNGAEVLTPFQSTLEELILPERSLNAA